MKVFYDERQSVAANSSFSPSAEKPAKVLSSWLKLGIPFEVCSFKLLELHDTTFKAGWAAYEKIASTD